MPFWKGKYPKYHLIDPLHWGRLPIMYANSKLSNFAKENANGTLKHESTSQQFYWFPDDQYCFCKHSNPQMRKSTFLRKDPFDGQYMETRSFDIEARRVLKFHTGGALICGPFGSSPRRTTFEIRNSGYKLPDKIFLGTW